MNEAGRAPITVISPGLARTGAALDRAGAGTVCTYRQFRGVRRFALVHRDVASVQAMQRSRVYGLRMWTP
jgi:hypothetical protein